MLENWTAAGESLVGFVKGFGKFCANMHDAYWGGMGRTYRETKALEEWKVVQQFERRLDFYVNYGC